MTATPCTCAICDHSRRILADTANVAPSPSRFDPGVDAETRLRPGLSRTARNAQRRPERLFVDSMGYDQFGAWHADKDGVA
jgi:hypothetical protein